MDRKKYIGSRMASLSPPVLLLSEYFTLPSLRVIERFNARIYIESQEKLTDLEMRFTADEAFR